MAKRKPEVEPADEFLLEATVGAHDEADHLTRLDFAGDSVHVSRCAEAPGARMRFRIQARDVSDAWLRL